MPQRTKEQKIRTKLKKNRIKTSYQDGPSQEDVILHAYFRKDITKSLIIILAIIALEFVLYYGTMNNHPSLILKLGK
ncbi:MAG: hypothetical protein WAT72_02645 [Microgenomates group bacterium]|jgi:hypothetical protein|nr:hypothetical protein [Candidatus Woesebacteria bacterium]MBP6882808.1 hypothetical protein [Candidatus Woesebacteria bacterium]QQR63616.1 MAG: hypothetical protein IPH70_03860 [Candidatus Roizmanbacteria bacterium]